MGGGARWRRYGERTEVRGFTIEGMVYVGNKPAHGPLWRENAVIDPTLLVAPSEADKAGATMPYYPSYDRISAQARRAHLMWHAGGRRDPSYGIGHIFLFFYGLERRLFVDKALDEAPDLIREVEELLAVYGDNHSFRQYASRFLETARAVQVTPPEPALSPEPRYEVPPDVLAQIGRLVAAGHPIPAKWALAWWLTDPQSRIRTPARRCLPEFASLFEIRFAAAFPDGLRMEPPRRKLRLVYQPSSNAFTADLSGLLGDVPDITTTRKPLAAIATVAEACTDALDGYSRFLGKSPEGRGSLEALRHLPADLAPRIAGDALNALTGWLTATVPDARAALQADQVFRRLGLLVEDGEKPTRQICIAASEILERCAFGMEPDPRHGGPVVGVADPLILFRLPKETAADAAAEDYAAAQALLALGAALVQSDEAVTAAEEQHLLEHLERALHLSAAQRTRLQAHLLLLMRAPPKLSALKSRFESFSLDRRQEVARFAITVAGADGVIAPAEIRLLERIYGLLGLNRKTLFSDIHALGGPDDPVTVRAADPREAGAPIPPRPGLDSSMPVSLDVERIRRIRDETARVSGMLSEIFTDEDVAAGIAPPRPAAPEPPVSGGTQADSTGLFDGLDAAHARLLDAAAARESLDRADFEALARAEGLLPDGAIETINDWAFDRVGDPLIEEGDPIVVAVHLLSSLRPGPG